MFSIDSEWVISVPNDNHIDQLFLTRLAHNYDTHALIHLFDELFMYLAS